MFTNPAAAPKLEHEAAQQCRSAPYLGARHDLGRRSGSSAAAGLSLTRAAQRRRRSAKLLGGLHVLELLQLVARGQAIDDIHQLVLRLAQRVQAALDHALPRSAPRSRPPHTAHVSAAITAPSWQLQACRHMTSCAHLHARQGRRRPALPLTCAALATSCTYCRRMPRQPYKHLIRSRPHLAVMSGVGVRLRCRTRL